MKKVEKQYRRTNLLQEHDYNYNLQDVEEPVLFRDSFPYDQVPKTRFNHRLVPMHFPDQIWITDTTFRDGQQAMEPFTAEQILHLYKQMHKLGGKQGLIRQSEFFVYTDKDRRALEKCMEMDYDFPEITTWIRASQKDFELVKSIGIQETGILVSCSDYHIFNKMGLTRQQALDKYLGIVKDAISYGIRPRCHLEDITRADFYGFVVPFVSALMELMQETGVPIKIRMCDTMGYGVPYPGAALPRSVPGIVYGLRFYAGVPSQLLEWHGHNDFHKVVVNASTAWLYGASSVNCSLLGIGERTGNCPLEAMVMEYAQLMGNDGGMRMEVITDIADYFQKEIGYHIDPKTPFVGSAFNSTRAGIHADGIMKDEEIYNIFDTKKILNRPVGVMLGEHSGAASIAYWINTHFRLPQELCVDKRSELVEKMRQVMDTNYAEGRNTMFSDHELEVMLEQADAEAYRKFLGL